MKTPPRCYRSMRKAPWWSSPTASAEKRLARRPRGLAMNELKKSVAAAGDGPLLRTAILNGIENANRAVSALGIGAGTTLAAVEIQNGLGRPYHVGDSMILVVGQRGKVKLQTVSHSPVGYAMEAGVLDEAEAMHHEDRHLVSNVIGIPDMRIEIGGAVKLSRYDTLLLASDGLFDNLYLDEIIQHIRKGPLAQAAARLVEQCQQRMNQHVPGVPRQTRRSHPGALSANWLNIFREHSGARTARIWRNLLKMQAPSKSAGGVASSHLA